MWAVVNIRPEHKKKQQRLPLLRQKSTVCGIVHLCMYEDSAGFWLLFAQLWIWFFFFLNVCLLLFRIIWFLLQDYNMIQTYSLWIFVDSLNCLIDFYCALYFGEQPIQFFLKNFTQSFQSVVDVFFLSFSKDSLTYALYRRCKIKKSVWHRKVGRG